ncbi:transmembrane protein, putative (macronuclear) [Tetrahymena thermophila SB210]|uniref:Transmembrane protein, putative n=1 Tax=Tetrahymena thermophila (strain SB210) TaxID=312017 RepID=W7XK19_TETTS|nr:transmembrane protein, putative [Tetrahymena thermophila SB210]EWS76141.1 transmembrane protein, putative [Tetrahymena thermophila SB210]|eukprot:XP_012651327.1 transmembrane protein, putative [Tetrahymena thermophila SB210]
MCIQKQQEIEIGCKGQQEYELTRIKQIFGLFRFIFVIRFAFIFLKSQIFEFAKLKRIYFNNKQKIFIQLKILISLSTIFNYQFLLIIFISFIYIFLLLSNLIGSQGAHDIGKSLNELLNLTDLTLNLYCNNIGSQGVSDLGLSFVKCTCLQTLILDLQLKFNILFNYFNKNQENMVNLIYIFCVLFYLFQLINKFIHLYLSFYQIKNIFNVLFFQITLKYIKGEIQLVNKVCKIQVLVYQNVLNFKI